MSDSPPPEQQKPDKKKQQEARSALECYLGKLRKACDAITTAEDWAEITGELNGLLGNYQLEIPQVNLGRLEGAMQLAEASQAGVSSACQALQVELENTINALPKSGGCSCGCVGGGILGALIAAAVLIGLVFAAIALLIRPVEINMVNQGCDDLPVLLGIPSALQPAINLLGADLPEVIPSNGDGLIIVRSLPVTFNVDGTDGQVIRVTVLGAQASYGISDNLADVVINGSSVLTQPVDLDVRARDRHEVIIVCR